MTEEIRNERIIAAPPEEVFDAFTSSGGQIALYGRDEPGWLVRSESEIRVGGAWTILFGPSPDRMYRHHHVYEIIDRPRRVVLSTTETRVDGSTLQFETELTFDAYDGGTLMTMIQRGLPTDELRAEHAMGVPNAFDRFEHLILGRGGSQPPFQPAPNR